MESYCLKCRQVRPLINEVISINNNKRQLRANCSVCGTKVFKFLPKQEGTTSAGVVSASSTPANDLNKEIDILKKEISRIESKPEASNYYNLPEDKIIDYSNSPGEIAGLPPIKPKQMDGGIPKYTKVYHGIPEEKDKLDYFKIGIFFVLIIFGGVICSLAYNDYFKSEINLIPVFNSTNSINVKPDTNNVNVSYNPTINVTINMDNISKQIAKEVSDAVKIKLNLTNNGSDDY